MELDILSATQVRGLSANEKARLVDYVFESLSAKADPLLFSKPDSVCLFVLKGALRRTYLVKVSSDRFHIHANPVRLPVERTSIEVDTDDFLVRTVVCAGYSVGGVARTGHKVAITGDWTFANTLLNVMGVLPSCVECGLRELQSQDLPAVVDDLPEVSLAHLERKLPFVVRRGAASWPASAWTIDSLLRDLGNNEDMSQVLRILVGNRPPMAPAYFAAPLPTSLYSALPAPQIGPFVFRSGETFLSNAGALANLHRDFVDGIAAVFFGARRFWFFPPSEAANLYPYPGKDADAQISHVRDPRAPDLSTFPKFAKARGVEVTVGPGDLVFVPAGWFHSVLTIELSVIVKLSADLHVSWPYNRFNAAPV